MRPEPTQHYETKVGRTGANARIRSEVAKDAFLISRGHTVTWEFYVSRVTQQSGPTRRLVKLLDDAGINVVYMPQAF